MRMSPEELDKIKAAADRREIGIDVITRQAISDIVAAFYAEVEADYVDTVFPDEDHVYYAFRQVQRWLEKTAQ